MLRAVGVVVGIVVAAAMMLSPFLLSPSTEELLVKGASEPETVDVPVSAVTATTESKASRSERTLGTAIAPYNRTAIILLVHRVHPMLHRTIIDLEGLIGDPRYTPMLWYHADIVKPDMLPRTALQLVPMRKEEELRHYSRAVFARLSGWGSPVQTAVTRWLKDQQHYDFAWAIEHDVYFSGRWRDLFDWYAHKDIDFIANEEPRPADWVHWQLCDVATEDRRAGWGMYIHRISRRFAAAVTETLQSGKSGHQECFFPTLCISLPWCKMSSWESQFRGILRYRPIVLANEVPLPSDVPKNEIGRLYHPVKNPESTRDLKTIARACARDRTCGKYLGD